MNMAKDCIPTLASKYNIFHLGVGKGGWDFAIGLLPTLNCIIPFSLLMKHNLIMTYSLTERSLIFPHNFSVNVWYGEHLIGPHVLQDH
jgi:hypothetical protein